MSVRDDLGTETVCVISTKSKVDERNLGEGSPFTPSLRDTYHRDLVYLQSCPTRIRCNQKDGGRSPFQTFGGSDDPTSVT